MRLRVPHDGGRKGLYFYGLSQEVNGKWAAGVGHGRRLTL
jgi:hypothetical protein